MNSLRLVGEHQRLDNGFTLVEVLVALLVLSIGLLGLAGLQTYSVASTHSAYLRSQASLLAYDIIERMRANKAQANLGAYDTAFGAAPAASDEFRDCESTSCTPAQLAVFDRIQWKCMLGAWDARGPCEQTLGLTGRLPDGDGEIIREANSDVYTVAVRWNDRDTGEVEGDESGNSETLEVTAEL